MNSIGQTESRKQKCGRTDGWTNKQTKYGQMNRQNYTNFKRNLVIMVIYVFELESRNENVDRSMDRKTDKRTDGITSSSKGS